MTANPTERIRAACEHLLAAGHDVTVAAVAEQAGISRATCYRDRQLRAIIDTYRSRHGEVLTITRLADRVDNLTQALEAVAAKYDGKKKKSAPSNALIHSRGGACRRISRRIPRTAGRWTG